MRGPNIRVRIRLTRNDAWLAWPCTLAVLIALCALGYPIAAAAVLALVASLWVLYVAAELERDTELPADVPQLNVNGVAYARCRSCERIKLATDLTRAGVCAVPCDLDQPREAA